MSHAHRKKLGRHLPCDGAPRTSCSLLKQGTASAWWRDGTPCLLDVGSAGQTALSRAATWMSGPAAHHGEWRHSIIATGLLRPVQRGAQNGMRPYADTAPTSDAATAGVGNPESAIRCTVASRLAALHIACTACCSFSSSSASARAISGMPLAKCRQPLAWGERASRRTSATQENLASPHVLFGRTRAGRVGR